MRINNALPSTFALVVLLLGGINVAAKDSAGNGAFVQPEWVNAEGARPGR